MKWRRRKRRPRRRRRRWKKERADGSFVITLASIESPLTPSGDQFAIELESIDGG